MKIFLGICAAVVLTFVATYALVSSRKAAQYARERQLLESSWEAERAELEAALKGAKRRSSAAPTVVTEESGAPRSSAQDILEKLKKIRVLSGDQRSASIRRIVHHLESLVDLGPEGLGPIREFLAKFEDVDYSGEVHDEDRGLLSEPEAKPSPAPVLPGRTPRLDTVLPPSLRLGLVQVLREMGSEQAEQVLAEMLTTSGRGVEVAYVVKALQELAPNKYRDIAIAAARDLLANPPAIDRPNRLDENAKNYLYGVLSMYNDPSFATVAQSLLVTADGHVDRTALSYLTGTMKEEAVPALYQAFKDTRVTNMWERASLATQLFAYAGTSSQANDVLKEVVGNDTLPTWLRATALQAVAGGRGTFFGGTSPSDPTQIKARIDLLMGLPEPTDERLARARTEAIQKLSDALAAGGEDTGRSFRNRLDRGQGQGAAEMPPPLPGTK